LDKILTNENISFEHSALVNISQCANGSMRDALSLLEQVIAFGERNVSLNAAQQILGTSVREHTLKLLEQVIAGDARQVITIVRELAANNADFNRVLKTLQTLIHQVSLVQIVPDGLEESLADIAQIKLLSSQVAPLDLQLFYQTALLGVRDLPYAPDMVSGFEMIVLRMLAFQPALVNTQIAPSMASVIAVATPVNIPAPAPALAASIATPVVAPVNIPAPAPALAPSITTPVVAPVNISDPAPAPVLLAANITEKIMSKTDLPSWAEVIPHLNLPGLTKIIAEHCAISKWHADYIELTLHEAQKPLLNAKHIERLQEALQKYLQNTVKLTINTGVVKTETPAAHGQRVQQAAHSAAETAIRSDKHIQQLEQTFAAKIENIDINTNAAKIENININTNTS